MKRLLLILVFSSLLIASAEAQSDRPVVAVVLSGGGAKGVAHIGALKVIEQAGIPIDIICGTSMGSLVGGLYCLGYSTDLLDSLVRAQDWTTLLSDRTDPTDLTLRQREEQNTYAIIRGLSNDRPQRGGLIRGRNLDRLLRQLCDGYLDSLDFSQLPIAFACVATDLVTNTEVDFHQGHLVQAMRASMAIPGVFTPVRIGDSVLVDGGLRNNYPADLARQMGADIIIGITVQGDPLDADEINDATTIFTQIIDINTKNKYQENIAMSDILVKVDVHGYSAASFFSSAIDTLIARGNGEARRHWDELIALRRHYRIDSLPPRQHKPIPRHSEPSRPHKTVTTIPIASVGFRFDTEEMGAIQLNAKLPLKTRLPMAISGTARLGKRIMARAEYTLITTRAGLNPTLSYTFRNNDIDIYTNGLRTHNIRYIQHSADITPVDLRYRLFDIQAGLRWDYFNYYGQLLSYSDHNTPLTDDHYLSYHITADLNTENHWYFPTRGTRFHAAYAYRTTNLISFDDKLGLNDISAHWRINISPSPRLTLQPMLYSRLVLSDTLPVAFYNAIGGESFGHIIEQQMPFAGMGHLEYIGPCLLAAQLQLQYRILSRHHLLLRTSAAVHGNRLQQLLASSAYFGLQVGYSYATLFGPIDLRIGYTNTTRQPYLLLNIGHLF